MSATLEEDYFELSFPNEQIALKAFFEIADIQNVVPGWFMSGKRTFNVSTFGKYAARDLEKILIRRRGKILN